MFSHKISIVFFVTLKCGALSNIISFDFPRRATNLLSANKNCSNVMSSKSSRFIAPKVMQVNVHTQAFFVCLLCLM